MSLFSGLLASLSSYRVVLITASCRATRARVGPGENIFPAPLTAPVTVFKIRFPGFTPISCWLNFWCGSSQRLITQMCVALTGFSFPYLTNAHYHKLSNNSCSVGYYCYFWGYYWELWSRSRSGHVGWSFVDMSLGIPHPTMHCI